MMMGNNGLNLSILVSYTMSRDLMYLKVENIYILPPTPAFLLAHPLLGNAGAIDYKIE